MNNTNDIMDFADMKTTIMTLLHSQRDDEETNLIGFDPDIVMEGTNLGSSLSTTTKPITSTMHSSFSSSPEADYLSDSQVNNKVCICRTPGHTWYHFHNERILFVDVHPSMIHKLKDESWCDLRTF